MNYRERLKQDLPKPPKPLLSVLAVPDLGISEKKTPSEPSKVRHAYQFVLRGGEGSGTYICDTSDLEQARNELLKQYGDRLMVVTKTND